MVYDTHYTDRVMIRVSDKGIIKDICESYRGETGWILTSLYLSSPSLHVQVTDGHRRKPMVTEEDNVQKKNKDNGIAKPKNHRRPAPFRLLDEHSNPTIF